MSLAENRSCRILIWSVLCLVCCQCADFSPALAQEKSRPNTAPSSSSAGRPSQRWLSLPEGGSSDLKQQVQWLQQLKGLMLVGSQEGESPATPQFDLEQLKLLLNAMKPAIEQLPEGAIPLKPDGNSSEQIAKMMADPVMREQVRKLLEQFSQNGTQRRGNEAVDSNGVPLPPGSNGGRKKLGDESVPKDPARAEAEQDLSPPPRSLQELMNRLIQQTTRQPNESSSENNTGDRKLNPSKLDWLRKGSGNPPKPGGQQQSDTQPTGAERNGTGRPEGSREIESQLGVGRNLNEPDANVSEPRNGLTRPSSNSETDQQPLGPRIRGAMPSRGGIQPSETNTRVEEFPKQNGEQQPEGELQTAPGRGNKPTPDKRGVDTGNRAAEQPTRWPVESGRQVPGTARPQHQPATPANSGNIPKPPPMDVRSELETKGFAQTLRTIIEQARGESLANPKTPPGVSTENEGTKNGSFKGLESSIIRMLDGIREDLVRESQKVPGAPTAAESKKPSVAPPPPPTVTPERPSTAGNVIKSLGNLFSEVAAEPKPQTATRRPSQTRPSGGMFDSPGTGSRSTGPLLMLLAVLGLVWYFLPRILTSIQKSLPGRDPLRATAGEAIASADIRTREDVVRAFHQYALQSGMSVPTWWTHREVERQVAGATPTLRPSIQTLANLYEQARYLPDDADFTPDQIGIARRELENVSRANHLG